MHTDKVTELIKEIDDLDFNSKKEIYQRMFSMGYITTEDMNDRFILISLIGLVTQKMKEKDKSMTPLSVLERITTEKKGTAFYQYLEALAIVVEDYSYGIKKIDPCGLKTSQEIINKIKELLNTWIPF